MGYLALPEKPVKGMAVAIALYPDGHTDDPENPGAKFYFAGDDPNRPEHRPRPTGRGRPRLGSPWGFAGNALHKVSSVLYARHVSR